MCGRYRVDEQIAELYGNTATLASGGYLVLNPTEALISIDVNSGRSTSARNVEETALATNLEAAEEVARQLRLRDLAGLVVVDFIDMMDLKNRKQVERRLKEALSRDRARVQVGRISQFGLLEMSRQRLRPSFNEINAIECTHCVGTGYVKAPETLTLTLLRRLEQELVKNTPATCSVQVGSEVITHILNHKRDNLQSMETRYGLTIVFHADATLPRDKFNIVTQGKSDKVKFAKEQDIEEDEVKPSAKPAHKKGNRNENAPSDNADKPKKKGLLQGLWRKIIE